MKLLIITQKVDRNDPILGFFHRWIEEFAKHCEKVTVVCLSEGEHNLPKNVKVLSLGKERGVSRLGYMLNFYHLIWRERKNYNTIFVHMNQEYILLGGLLWKLLGKKVTMWRNHYAGSLLTRIAMALSDKIFCTSKYSFTARSKKTILMPVGIDTERFLPSEEKCSPNSILSIGRISPSKNLELVVTALGNLKKDNIGFKANIYGDVSEEDASYFKQLKDLAVLLNVGNDLTFHPGVPNLGTPAIYRSHEIFVNTSPSGMYDKTIFEAMASGTMIVTSNKNLSGIIGDTFMFKEGDAQGLSKTLAAVFGLSVAQKALQRNLTRNLTVKEHNLKILVVRLYEEMTAH